MQPDQDLKPDAATPWWKIRGVGAAAVVLAGVAVLVIAPRFGSDPHVIDTPTTGAPPPITASKDRTQPRDHKSQDHRSPKSALDSSAVPLSPEEAKDGCLIPALEEGESVPSKEIQYDKDVSIQASGGNIEPGLYRLSAAYSSKKDFTAGRWSMLLDLAEDGQGAYYRKLGLRAMKSRLRWTTKEGRLFLTMICPDQVIHRFDYAFNDQGLKLMAEGGFVLPFERYGDSRVQKLIEPEARP